MTKMSLRSLPEYDVVIAGAGPVGMALAVALHHLSHRKILMVEAQEAPILPLPRLAADQGRILALSWSSVQTLSALGIWQNLGPQAIPLSTIHVSQHGWLGSTLLHAESLGVGALGWVVREPALHSALHQALAAAGIEVRYGTRLVRAMPSVSHTTLQLSNDSKPLSASLLVGADGTESSVRTMFDVPVRRRNLSQHALVFTLRGAADLGSMAYERFLGEGVLGVLPLGARQVGCTYVADMQRVQQLAAQPEPVFLQEVDAMMGGRLHPEALLGAPRRFALPWLMAQAITAPRMVLIGNAAHTLHPIAAQGFNLGLRDVAALVLALTGKHDPGSQDILASHTQERLADYRQTAGWLQALLALFGARLPGLPLLRGAGLSLADVAPGLGAMVSLWGMGTGKPYLPALWQGGLHHAS